MLNITAESNEGWDTVPCTLYLETIHSGNMHRREENGTCKGRRGRACDEYGRDDGLANLESPTPLIGVLKKSIFVDGARDTASHEFDVAERSSCVACFAVLSSFRYHDSLSLLLNDTDETEILRSETITHRLQK